MTVPESQSTVLIRHVRILDARGSQTEDGAILIEGHRIAFVGPERDAARNADMVIQGGGRTAIPGLINCHTHLMRDDQIWDPARGYFDAGEALGLLEAAARAKRAVESGITTFRDCNAPGYGIMALKAAFERGLLPGPRLFVSGQAICATGGHMHDISYEADGPAEVCKGVRTQIRAGADFIKFVPESIFVAPIDGDATEATDLELTVEELRAGVEAAHDLHRRVTAHAVSRDGIARALDAGVDCIEHGYDLTDHLIDRLAAAGAWIVTTLSVHDAFSRYGGSVLKPERIESSRRILARGLDAASRASRAGVKIACGTDGGIPFNPVWKIAPELRLLSAAGLTPLQVLSAATRSGAELLGVDGDLGTIEVGKVGDVLVLDGDPLADLSSFERVDVVVKDGRVLRNIVH